MGVRTRAGPETKTNTSAAHSAVIQQEEIGENFEVSWPKLVDVEENLILYILFFKEKKEKEIALPWGRFVEHKQALGKIA